MPLPGRLCLAIELVQLTTIPQAALNFEAGPVMIDCHRIRCIGLELDGVGARGFRRLDQAKRSSNVAVAVSNEKHLEVAVERRLKCRK